VNQGLRPPSGGLSLLLLGKILGSAKYFWSQGIENDPETARDAGLPKPALSALTSKRKYVKRLGWEASCCKPQPSCSHVLESVAIPLIKRQVRDTKTYYI
jgi:hypothetical protein